MMNKCSIEQWEKLKRQYSKVQDIQKGVSGKSPGYLKDEISHFFQDCFHLKDWLKKDETQLEQKIEDLFDKNNGIESFKICADFANREKHSEAIRCTRIDPNASIKKQNLKLVLNSPVTSFYSWEIEANGNYYDTFTLANDCMRHWQELINNENLTYLK